MNMTGAPLHYMSELVERRDGVVRLLDKIEDIGIIQEEHAKC